MFTSQALPYDLQQIYKKLQKKDENTRLKGLQELLEYSKTTFFDFEFVFKKFNSTFYAKHREILYSILLELVKQKQLLIPLFPRIIGQWIVAMHDSNENTRKLALKSFSECFKNKQKVLSHYKSEFVQFLKEDFQPDRLLSDQENEMNQQRVLVDCLNALNSMSDVVDKEDFLVLFKKYRKLVSGREKSVFYALAKRALELNILDNELVKVLLLDAFKEPVVMDFVDLVLTTNQDCFDFKVWENVLKSVKSMSGKTCLLLFSKLVPLLKSIEQEDLKVVFDTLLGLDRKLDASDSLLWIETCLKVVDLIEERDKMLEELFKFGLDKEYTNLNSNVLLEQLGRRVSDVGLLKAIFKEEWCDSLVYLVSAIKDDKVVKLFLDYLLLEYQWRFEGYGILDLISVLAHRVGCLDDVLSSRLEIKVKKVIAEKEVESGILSSVLKALTSVKSDELDTLIVNWITSTESPNTFLNIALNLQPRLSILVVDYCLSQIHNGKQDVESIVPIMAKLLTHNGVFESLYELVREPIVNFTNLIMLTNQRLDEELIDNVLFSMRVLELLLNDETFEKSKVVDLGLNLCVLSEVDVNHLNAHVNCVSTLNEVQTIAKSIDFASLFGGSGKIVVEDVGNAVHGYVRCLETFVSLTDVYRVYRKVDEFLNVEDKIKLYGLVLGDTNGFKEFDYDKYVRKTNMIANPLYGWNDSATTLEIKHLPYDHDGLSLYARLCIFGLNLQEASFNLYIKQYPHVMYELVKFYVVANSTQFSAFVFQEFAAEHVLNYKADLDGVLALVKGTGFGEYVFGRIEENLGLLVFDTLSQYLDSKDVHVLEKVGEWIRDEEFRKLIAFVQPEREVFPGVEIIQQNLSGFISRMMNMKRGLAPFGPTEIQRLFFVADFIHTLTQNGHILTQDSINANQLLRWIRTNYDQQVFQKELITDEVDQILFDAYVCKSLSSIIKIKQQFDLNMIKFITDLVILLFEMFEEEPLDTESFILLYQLLDLWEVLEEVKEVDSSSWVTLVDYESDMRRIVLQAFLYLSGESIESDLGIDMLQSRVSILVTNFEKDGLLREIVEAENELVKAMYHRNQEVQKTAYLLLGIVYKKRAEQDSLAVAMNTLDINQVGFKVPIMNNLVLKSTNDIHHLFGYCLSWLLILDQFQGDITFDIRTRFTSILRQDEKLFIDFFEFLMKQLRVFDGTMFNVRLYDFQELFMEAFDSSVEDSISILCSHLYFKALARVPVLVRLWYASTVRKNTLAIETFTETFYSPVLIKNELMNVQALADSELNIRINFNKYEISAGYIIEESELDLTIKIPSCYPLKLADIASGTGGGKQAGVSESRWRAWLLSVSSVIIGQNGTVSDALVLFKKNVALHFEGIEDCAICYSVISVVDRSTPQKKCKVCKHIFHGSCLFKWFKSSTQNTCPLCRQPF